MKMEDFLKTLGLMRILRRLTQLQVVLRQPRRLFPASQTITNPYPLPKSTLQHIAANKMPL